MTILSYETRRDAVITTAWEIWTKNGLGLDVRDREETSKSVADAVNNTYTDDTTDADWLKETLRILGHSNCQRVARDALKLPGGNHSVSN